MRSVRISEVIVPVSESPREFDRLSEQARFVAAVQEGLADADAGRLRDHAEVVERMRARFANKRNR